MDVFADLDRTVLQSLQMPDDAKTYYTPVGGSRGKLDDVIFRAPVTPVVGDDLIFEGTGPQFSVHRDDAPKLAQHDLFERAGVRYVVKTVDKDEGSLWVAFCRLE